MVRRTLFVLIVLAAVLAALVWLSYHDDIAAARIRISSGSKVISTPCGLIEYADVGDGPAILAIHGAGGGFDQSRDVAKDFLDPVHGGAHSRRALRWLFNGRPPAGGS
jgi:2-hydroxy-6-oxonona-2,4-dienedioate hydrolase